ncbi:glycosyltransferase family 2 protein [Kocuria rosea]|uniref:glycosyltransferase family 2 protein n=1 Tax=Kocuria rosea TaxID=1275 RepID=UPI0025404008|nr:glycosyltransferase family 2 protein [Kocuria rosea]WIG16369.1 glycosyltransferase family 2 protein [Kocuria rosea]
MTSITCIVPTHCRPIELNRALTSILEQTAQPTRILVVDDARSPSTSSVVKSLQSAVDIEVLHTPWQKGSASKSRNFGASRATTKYLAFLDDDDYWHSEYLESLLTRAEEKSADVVLGWITLANGARTVGTRKPTIPMDEESTITANPGFTGSNFLIRRSCFDALGGFDPQLPVYNDLDLLNRILAAELNVDVVKHPLVLQTTDGGTHLSSRSKARALGIDLYKQKYRSRLKRSGIRRLKRDKYVALRYPEQKAILRAWYYLLTIVHSDYSDLRRKLVKIVCREPVEYK